MYWASCWNLCHISAFQISCCHLPYGFRNLSSLHVLFFAAVPSPFALAMAPYPSSSLSQRDWEAHLPPSHALRYFFMLPTPVSWAGWYWEDSCHVLLGYEMCLNRNWYYAHQLVIWVWCEQSNGQGTVKSPALLGWRTAWVLQVEPSPFWWTCFLWSAVFKAVICYMCHVFVSTPSNVELLLVLLT